MRMTAGYDAKEIALIVEAGASPSSISISRAAVGR